MKVLVTGAAGFIGSHLCEALLARGDTVTGLDCFDGFYDPAIKHRNLHTASLYPGFRLIEGDVRDYSALSQALHGENVDLMVHLAARVGVRASLDLAMLYQDVNVKGTMMLLEAMRAKEVKSLIFASSSSVYGGGDVPFSESDSIDRPLSPYAATKACGELLCRTYHELYRLNVTTLRFFTVYGPRQRPDLAIHKFARQITNGQPITVFGHGRMMRDFTYIDDIINGILRAIDQCGGYHVYNLGSEQPIRLSLLVTALETALNRRACVKFSPIPRGDVPWTYADISLARHELGYCPATSILGTGLPKFVKWFKEEACTA